jgi:low temperature requirement protein LtrA
VLRARDGAGVVRPIELFFDLVYVLAVTQLTHHLLDHLTLRGAFETLVLLLFVWLGWMHAVWTTNYFDMGARRLRLVLLGVMLASLVMASSLPRAYEDRGFTVAAGIVAILVVGTVVQLVLLGRGNPLRIVLERVIVWWAAWGVVILAGGIADGDARLALWAAAVAGLYLVMWLGFPLPWLGRSHTVDYTIAGEHLAHRCFLFIIVALGESVLVIGSNFGELPGSAARIAAFVVAFLTSAALWWIYFDRGAEAGMRVISEAEDPARLGLTAYTYFHIPMVAGIIVTAGGDELALAQPGDEPSAAAAALILGGPALYLAGNALFKVALWGYVPVSRLAGLAALAALVPVAAVASNLALSAAATGVLVGVVVWDAWAYREVGAEAPARTELGPAR